MTAVASLPAEKFLALVERVGVLQHHVGGVTLLAAGFEIRAVEQGPQPVLVAAMRFLHARGRTAIAVVARRTTEALGIVDLHQSGVGVRSEGFAVRTFRSAHVAAG